MGSEVELKSAQATAEYLASQGDGIVLFALAGCEPCELLWNALRFEPFANLPRARVVLSNDNPADQEYAAAHDLSRFPVLVFYEKGVEQKRFRGVPAGHRGDPERLADLMRLRV